jgi:hypothetical protein
VKEDLMIKRKIINKNDLEEDGTTDEIYWFSLGNVDELVKAIILKLK